MGKSSLDFIVRVWVNNDDYWSVYWDLNEQIFAALKAADIEVPFDQIDVNIKNDKEKGE